MNRIFSLSLCLALPLQAMANPLVAPSALPGGTAGPLQVAPVTPPAPGMPATAAAPALRPAPPAPSTSAPSRPAPGRDVAPPLAREALPATLAASVRDAILAERRMIAAERLEYSVGPTEVSHLSLSQITGGIGRPVPLGEQQARNARAQQHIAEEDAAIAQLADAGVRARLTAQFARRTCRPEARAYNWVREGVVTTVQNQRQCGSCWAFGALGSMESAYQILLGERHDLSEQYLVDNVEYTGPGAFGKCGGNGHMEPAEFLVRHGTFSERDLPYTSVPGESWLRPNAPFRALTWGLIPNTTDDTIELADLKRGLCEHGPLAISMVAPPQNYIGGVLTRFFPKTQRPDHTVLLVGWDDAERVWIIKNSWGAGWGENALADRESFPFGYARVRYGAQRLGTHASWIQPRRLPDNRLVMTRPMQAQPSAVIRQHTKRDEPAPAPAPGLEKRTAPIDWSPAGVRLVPMKPHAEPIR